jgi:hypothetical protein
MQDGRATPETPAPWDAYGSRAFFEGKPLEAANDTPSPLTLWALDIKGWTWAQYVAWWKVHPRHCRDAPPF